MDGLHFKLEKETYDDQISSDREDRILYLMGRREAFPRINKNLEKFGHDLDEQSLNLSKKKTQITWSN